MRIHSSLVCVLGFGDLLGFSSTTIAREFLNPGLGRRTSWLAPQGDGMLRVFFLWLPRSNRKEQTRS